MKPTRRSREGGAALLIALLMLVVVMMVGAATAQTGMLVDKSASHDRDRRIALEAAEAALRDAEADLEGAAGPASLRVTLLADASGFGNHCDSGAGAAARGLCLGAEAGAVPVWQSVDLADEGVSVAFGSFTGARMPVGQGALPARLPRYLIELLPLARAGEDAGASRSTFYRITALGFGTRESTRVVLQSGYRRAARAPGESL